MTMIPSPPSITPRTFAVVQDLMRRDGLDSGDAEQVALYIERLIARERFFRTVSDVRQKTENVPEDELRRMIDEAIDEVNLDRGDLLRGVAPSQYQ